MHTGKSTLNLFALIAGIFLSATSSLHAQTLTTSLTTTSANDNKSATELGRYRMKVYRAVGARWYAKINDVISWVPRGHIRIQYTIYSDGSVATKVLEGDDQSQKLLRTVCQNAITESAPFTPFSDALRRQVGASFTDDFTFRVEGKGPD